MTSQRVKRHGSGSVHTSDGERSTLWIRRDAVTLDVALLRSSPRLHFYVKRMHLTQGDKGKPPSRGHPERGFKLKRIRG